MEGFGVHYPIPARWPLWPSGTAPPLAPVIGQGGRPSPEQRRAAAAARRERQRPNQLSGARQNRIAIGGGHSSRHSSRRPTCRLATLHSRGKHGQGARLPQGAPAAAARPLPVAFTCRLPWCQLRDCTWRVQALLHPAHSLSTRYLLPGSILATCLAHGVGRQRWSAQPMREEQGGICQLASASWPMPKSVCCRAVGLLACCNSRHAWHTAAVQPWRARPSLGHRGTEHSGACRAALSMASSAAVRWQQVRGCQRGSLTARPSLPAARTCLTSCTKALVPSLPASRALYMAVRSASCRGGGGWQGRRCAE